MVARLNSIEIIQSVRAGSRVLDRFLRGVVARTKHQGDEEGSEQRRTRRRQQ
jgi:hypothetical protein